jgi:GNAT superfamily N-acetyltransferase
MMAMDQPRYATEHIEPEIRPFAKDYASALYALMADWDKSHTFPRGTFDESLKAILELDGNEIVLAFEAERLVGYAQIIVCHHLGFEPSLEVMQLLVAQDRRNGGIGKRLMAYAENRALELGLNKVQLHSQGMRSRAHVFYEGLGYEFTKISKFYEKRLED